MKHIFVFRCFPTSLQGFTVVHAVLVWRWFFRFVVSDPRAEVGIFRFDVDDIYGGR